MAWTQTQIDALKDAYAQGVLTVSVNGRTVTYRSGAEMLQAIKVMESEVNPPTSIARPAVRSVRFGRLT
jgi:hypothetical protein